MSFYFNASWLMLGHINNLKRLSVILRMELVFDVELEHHGANFGLESRSSDQRERSILGALVQIFWPEPRVCLDFADERGTVQMISWGAQNSFPRCARFTMWRGSEISSLTTMKLACHVRKLSSTASFVCQFLRFSLTLPSAAIKSL
jgi:hypothetical protein